MRLSVRYAWADQEKKVGNTKDIFLDRNLGSQSIFFPINTLYYSILTYPDAPSRVWSRFRRCQALLLQDGGKSNEMFLSGKLLDIAYVIM